MTRGLENSHVEASLALNVLQHEHKHGTSDLTVSSSVVSYWFKREGERRYHEEGVRRLHETLELVLSLLELSWRVEQIDVVLENLRATDLKKKKLRKSRGREESKEKERRRKEISPLLRWGKCDEDGSVKTLDGGCKRNHSKMTIFVDYIYIWLCVGLRWAR